MPTPVQSAEPARQPEQAPHGVRIKVVGVGGAGNNAINQMIASGMEGVEFIALNTDIQALQISRAGIREQIGARLTNGLGAGSDPDIGRRAALDDSDKILEALDGADMVFVTAGLGGGTGTGAAPVIAALASEMGALTVAIVTRPFGFEGKRRMAIAEWGIHHLLDYVDTLIVIPNEKLLAIASDAPFFESFRVADDFLRQAVQGISDIITTAGVINRDFADVRTTMAGMGYGVMGTASRSGPNRAIDAVMGAMASPLLEAGAMDGARGILINVTGSSSLRLTEVNAASTVIRSVAHEDANIIFGAVLDERLGDEVKVTVVATGFHEEGRIRAARRRNRLREPEAITVPEQVFAATPPSLVEAQPLFLNDAGADPDIAAMTPALAPSEIQDIARDADDKVTLDPETQSLMLEPDRLALEEDAREDLLEVGPPHEVREAINEPGERPSSVRERVAAHGDGIEKDADSGRQEEEVQVHEENTNLEADPLCVERQMVSVSSVELSLPRLPLIGRETVHLNYIRRAAMAAYAAASDAEEEPVAGPRAAVPLSFADVLEARRRFVDAATSREPEVEAESAMSPEEERAIEVLRQAMSHHEAGKRANAETQDDFDLPAEDILSASEMPPAEMHERLAIAHEHAREEPERGSYAEILHPASGEAQLRDLFSRRESGDGEVPRPLPDFKRRLHRGESKHQDWEVAQTVSEISLRPSLPESENDPDELDIPAFLRRGRG